MRKNLASKQVFGSFSEDSLGQKIAAGGQDYQSLLYHEILSLRKDLENQKYTSYIEFLLN